MQLRIPLRPQAVARFRPEEAFFSVELQEFILPYDAERTAELPDETFLEFLQSTYEAAADLGKWGRALLECPLGKTGTHVQLNRPMPTAREKKALNTSVHHVIANRVVSQRKS